MTDAPETLPRSLLEQLFPGQPRAIAAFESQGKAVQEAATNITASAEATQALQDATVLTLSANETLANERIFRVAEGVFSLTDDGTFATLAAPGLAHVSGGLSVTFITTADTSVVLPPTGTLATLSGTETLVNKSLSSARLLGLDSYVDDAAAAAGGVPVNGLYRTGSAVMIRVA